MNRSERIRLKLRYRKLRRRYQQVLVSALERGLIDGEQFGILFEESRSRLFRIAAKLPKRFDDRLALAKEYPSEP